MDTTISYQRLWELFKKNFAFLLISAIVFAGAAFAVSHYLITPRYQSTTALLVNRSQNNQQAAAYNDQQADVQIIYTYRDLVTRPAIVDPVESSLSNRFPDINRASLQHSITTEASQNSQIFSINARSNDPYEARDIANRTADVFRQRISQLMPQVSRVSVVSRATVSGRPVFPNTRLFTAAGFLLGIFIAIVVILIRELMDNTYRDVEFVNKLGLNNLATVNYANFHHHRRNR
ncbi:YveK family protein [Oenococcus alcoholitolerans]|uniref:YveK family protein n=1 Tax=Oenococcus alcoholitolerans TaxID=931074 RepID=UPI003F73112D